MGRQAVGAVRVGRCAGALRAGQSFVLAVLQVMFRDTLTHSILHLLLCCRSWIQIHTPSLIAVCQMMHTHFFSHWCVSDHVYRYSHAFTTSLIAVCQITQIHSHTRFTHCYVSNHGYKYTLTLTSLVAVCQITHTNTLTHTLQPFLCVKSCRQIHSLTYFTHCCLSNHADIYTLTQAYLQNCSAFWNQTFACQCLTTKQSVVKRWVCTLQL